MQWVRKGFSQWIAKDSGRFVEGDRMFLEIMLGLGRVPFKLHASTLLCCDLGSKQKAIGAANDSANPDREASLRRDQDSRPTACLRLVLEHDHLVAGEAIHLDGDGIAAGADGQRLALGFEGGAFDGAGQAQGDFAVVQGEQFVHHFE